MYIVALLLRLFVVEAAAYLPWVNYLLGENVSATDTSELAARDEHTSLVHLPYRLTESPSDDLLAAPHANHLPHTRLLLS